MRFESPWYLIGLVLIPLLPVFRHYRIRKDRPRLRFSSVAALKAAGSSPKAFLRFVPGLLRLSAMMLVVLALARPQSYIDIFKSYTEGLDIVLALDVSTSMRAEDLAKGKNRLDVAKEVVDWFLSKRETDRVGMVVFAAVAFTQCPLTLDYGLVRQFLETLETGMVEDGTAIG
ncbi:MAG TPA: VWA domain-containing protein, partial [bacterium]|nr:VWA domain-containing protein [bacterium]